MGLTATEMAFRFSPRKLRARMAEVDMTAAELVAALERADEKTSGRTVDNWITGATEPEFRKFLALLVVLQVEPGDLLERD